MKNKIILICGRENLSADAQFLSNFRNELEKLGFQVIDEHALIPNRSWVATHFGILRCLYAYLGIAKFKQKIVAYFDRFRTPLSVELRVKKLAERLKTLNFDVNNLYVVGRSAGALVATKLTHKLPIQAVFAIGYPFIHPSYGKQKFRTQHLKNFQTPLYIFQGENDAYGNRQQIQQVHMSSSVKLFYFRTDHDFILDVLDWDTFMSLIKNYTV